MSFVLGFLCTWWYCYDDHLAEWTGQPWVGGVPLWVWIVLMLGFILTGPARSRK